MKEWFFLHRIALERADIALGNVERPSPIEPNFADAWQTIEDEASMAAGKASHAVVRQLLVESAFDRPVCQNIFEDARFSDSGCHLLT
jgi:hypothetical protein